MLYLFGFATFVLLGLGAVVVKAVVSNENLKKHTRQKLQNHGTKKNTDDQ